MRYFKLDHTKGVTQQSRRHLSPHARQTTIEVRKKKCCENKNKKQGAGEREKLKEKKKAQKAKKVRYDT